MKVLQTGSASQSIKFIPRSKTYDGLYLTDETKNVTTQITITSSSSNDYYETINAVFNLVENRFYKLVVKNGTNIVYRDKVFCTDQVLTNGNFNVNSGVYNENTTTNEFLMYE